MSGDPVWTRAWETDDGRIHVEVRDKNLRIETVEAMYPGKDHTFHIILKKNRSRKKAPNGC